MTTQPDPIPAREQAFATWLRAALLAAMPHSIARRTEDVVYSVFNRPNVPRGLCAGDAQRALMRIANEGLIEWCGEDMASVRRRVDGDAPTLDASRLRAIADAGEARLAHKTLEWRGALAIKMQTDGTPIERIASMSAMAALAEAREEGYRAAVADLLGAVPQ